MKVRNCFSGNKILIFFCYLMNRFTDKKTLQRRTTICPLIKQGKKIVLKMKSDIYAFHDKIKVIQKGMVY